MTEIAHPRLIEELTQDEQDRDVAIRNRGMELYHRLSALVEARPVFGDHPQAAVSSRKGSRGWLDRVWVEGGVDESSARTTGICWFVTDILGREGEGEGVYRRLTDDHNLIGLNHEGGLEPPALNNFLYPAQRERVLAKIAVKVDALEEVRAKTSLGTR